MLKASFGQIEEACPGAPNGLKTRRVLLLTFASGFQARAGHKSAPRTPGLLHCSAVSASLLRLSQPRARRPRGPLPRFRPRPSPQSRISAPIPSPARSRWRVAPLTSRPHARTPPPPQHARCGTSTAPSTSTSSPPSASPPRRPSAPSRPRAGPPQPAPRPGRSARTAQSSPSAARPANRGPGRATPGGPRRGPSPSTASPLADTSTRSFSTRCAPAPALLLHPLSHQQPPALSLLPAAHRTSSISGPAQLALERTLPPPPAPPSHCATPPLTTRPSHTRPSPRVRPQPVLAIRATPLLVAVALETQVYGFDNASLTARGTAAPPRASAQSLRCTRASARCVA